MATRPLTAKGHNVHTRLVTFVDRPKSKSKKSFKGRVMGIVHEPKWTLTESGSTSVSTTPYFQIMNLISQGDTATSRDGNEIFMTTFDLRIQLVGADATNLVRIMIYYDRQFNNTNPTTAGLAVPLDTLSINNSIYAQHNINSRKRLKWIFDRTYSLITNTTDQTDKYQRHISIHKKIKMPTIYTGNAGSLADILTGGLILAIVSDSSAVTHPTFTYSAKLNFRDR